MAKKRNLAADLTMMLPGVPGKRGRKPTGKAMTNAERQAKYRETHKAVETGTSIARTIKRFAEDFDLTEQQITRELLRFALCNRNWAQTGFPLRVTKKEGG
jgi:hypothetical protein